MKYKLAKTVAKALGMGFVLTACTTATLAESLGFSDCHVNGISTMVRCGVLQVPENYAEPAGRMLDLKVVIVPAVEQPGQPDPVFALAGGPGQSAVQSAALFSQSLRKANKSRDLVLMDQRGTGELSPLQCDMDLEVIMASSMDNTYAEVAQCLASLDADLGAYSTTAHIRDLEKLRVALGVDQVNLYGGSYGTRAALVYLREAPQSVRSAILDGVAPLQMRIGTEFGVDGQQALDGVFTRCEQSESCNREFPNIRQRFSQLLESLDQSGQTVSFPDPATGEERTETINRNALALGMRGLLYSPRTQRLIPMLIAEGEQGNWQPFLGAAHSFAEAIADTMNPLLLFSVLCAEDFAEFGTDDIAQAERDSFLGVAQVQTFIGFCSQWPRQDREWNLDPVTSEKPVLLLSGQLDPVTPPRRAETALQTLENAQHIVVPNSGHIVAGAGCMPDVIAQFIEQASVSDLDSTCAEDVTYPSFFTSILGPDPAGQAAAGESP